jgi:hypothetical protein
MEWVRRVRRGAVVSIAVLALALAGCAAGSPSRPRTVSTSSCTPGKHPVGTPYTATLLSVPLNLVAGRCFDVQSDDQLGARLTALRTTCESLGLEPEINRLIGHGVLVVSQSTTSPDAGGVCSFLTLQILNGSSVSFEFMWNAHDSTYTIAKQYALDSSAGPIVPMSGIGDQAVVQDSRKNGVFYSVLAGSHAGREETAALIRSSIPTSTSDWAAAVEETPGWMKLVLDATDKIAAEAPPDPSYGDGPP